MQYLILYILVGIFLLVCIRLGLTAQVQKRTAGWLVLARLSLFILLIAKIVSFLTTLNWLTFLQTCLLIIDLVLVEMAFRRKRLTFGDPHLNNLVLMLSLLILIIIIW